MDSRAFFDALERSASSNTRVVATLRRSMAEDPGAFAPAFPIVEPLLHGASDKVRRMAYLCAGLWAIAQRRASGTPISLVEALRRVAHQGESGGAERLATALLDADPDELVWRLRHAVQWLSTQGYALDWPRLLDDLLSWQHPQRWVQQRWARDFWRRPSDQQEQTLQPLASLPAAP
jgi:CRISPR system Cascade subunit CasB